MAAGLPVITSRIGQAEEIVKASGAGQLVDGSPTSIASAAVKILSDQELCEEYSTNAVRYAASLDWGTVLRPVLDFTVSA
jgi:glycosyltransferase involved in cell wall biosynthesis